MPRDQAREKSALGPGVKSFFSWFLALALSVIAPFSMGSHGPCWTSHLKRPGASPEHTGGHLGGAPAGSKSQARLKALVERRRCSHLLPQDEKLLAGTPCNSSTLPLGQTTRNRLTRDAFADLE